MKSKYYVSLKTGNKYLCSEYINHGYGGFKHGYKDLPKDEYPYTFEYEDESKQEPLKSFMWNGVKYTVEQ